MATEEDVTTRVVGLEEMAEKAIEEMTDLDERVTALEDTLTAFMRKLGYAAKRE